MQLNFGKFKGYELDNVPTTYLAYLLEQDFVNDEIKAECVEVINYRYSEFDLSKKSIDKSIINNAFKRLVMKHHPDKGGNHQAMVALNEFREILIKSI